MPQRAARARGASFFPALNGDHALITPPLVITAEQVEALAGAIDRALWRVEANV